MKLILGLRDCDELRAIARPLAILYDAVYAPITSIGRYALAARDGILALRPNLPASNGATLHNPYFRGRCRELWELIFGQRDRVVVPDISSAYDVGMIHRLGGVVVSYGKGTGAPNIREIIVSDKENLLLEIVGKLDAMGYKVSPRKPRIYVGTSIHTNKNFTETFDKLIAAVEENGMDALYPLEDIGIVHNFEEKPLKRFSEDVVSHDLSLIAQADGGLFYLPSPSIGAAMEIMSLAVMEKPVVVVAPEPLVYHSWLHAFAKVLWGGLVSLDEAAKWLKSLFVIERGHT